jgi:hypothetical protein
MYETTLLTLPLGALNGARGSLRIKLHNRLYAPCSTLLSGSKCGIKEKVFYQYHKALENTNAWPIEVHGYKKSINQLLSLLKRFKYNDPHPDGQDPLECMNSLKLSVVAEDSDSLDRMNSLKLSVVAGDSDSLDRMNSLKLSEATGYVNPLGCMNSLKFKEVVEDAIAHVDDQFDGLCLGKNLVPSSLFSQLTRRRLHLLLNQQIRGRGVLEPP